MYQFANIHARQIIDSRGNPTIEVDSELIDGSFGRASVPSGASTGEYEAIELRDNGNQYNGKSVIKVVNNINNVIKPALMKQTFSSIKEVDQILINIDGTENKSNLGANATLGVSMATIRAFASSNKTTLYKFISPNENLKIPVPMMNILNGGQHADNNIDIQEFMIFPLGLPTFSDALRCGCEIFLTLKDILKKSGHNTAVGDEGGFAPNLFSNEEAIQLILKSIEESGYIPGKEVAIALDVAASELYDKTTQQYCLHSENKTFTSIELIDYYQNLCNKYPIVSIEDGLDQNDWCGWSNLVSRLGNTIQIVGDDLTVTNLTRLRKAIQEKAINSILIKLNQIGTVSETLDAIILAQQHDLGVIISHRSGETEDTFISDLAVATNAGQIKTGSLCRGERIAKYNQLIRIEEAISSKDSYFSFSTPNI